MVLQYCSDLHLEFPENKQYLLAHPMRRKGDILVMAGDIVPFAVMEKHGYFFDLLSDTFGTVYWLPGNHEYYSSDISGRSGAFQEEIRKNVFLVNNFSHQQGNVKLIFSTLWSRISPINEWDIERSISDFSAIRNNGKRFSAAHFNQLHLDSLAFLRREMDQERTGKKVVITHHVPTFLHYPEVYKRSVLNEAFGTELFDLIDESSVDYWIYGHHHSNIPDFTIGKTSLRTNQLGYVRMGEHRLFDAEKVILLNEND